MFTVFKVFLWLVFFAALWRALSRQHLIQPSARMIWLLFFLWSIAATLWGDETELFFNRVFDGVPVALVVKSGCMLLTFYLYYLLLKSLQQSIFFGVLNMLVPVVVVCGTVWLIVDGDRLRVDYLDRRFLVIGVRDAVMAVYAVLIFIPFTTMMLKKEDYAPMRVKHGAALIKRRLGSWT